MSENKYRQSLTVEEQNGIGLKPRLLYAEFISYHPKTREAEHSHDFAELVFVRNGRGTVTVNGLPYAVSRGDLILYHIGEKHWEESSDQEPLEIQVLAFDRLKVGDLPAGFFVPLAYGHVFTTGEDAPAFFSLFDSLLAESHHNDRINCDIISHLAQVILLCLYRLLRKQKDDDPLVSGTHVLHQILAYIDRHYKENITLDNIASACFANKYYLSHLFSRIKGYSIGTYILEKRLNEACQLLRTSSLTIKEVAKEVGFNDAAYFGRIFKSRFRQTPLAFRRNAQDK